jgi:hypothetical protein
MSTSSNKYMSTSSKKSEKIITENVRNYHYIMSTSSKKSEKIIRYKVRVRGKERIKEDKRR